MNSGGDGQRDLPRQHRSVLRAECPRRNLTSCTENEEYSRSTFGSPMARRSRATFVRKHSPRLMRADRDDDDVSRVPEIGALKRGQRCQSKSGKPSPQQHRHGVQDVYADCQELNMARGRG